MYRTIGFGVAVFAFCASASCQAGGFFRRVPEVGEWARYEVQIEIKESYDEHPPHMVVFGGTFTIKCVGEDVVDDRRHLWIECREDYALQNGRTYRTIIKLLVPEDEIVDGQITADDARGWYGWVDKKPESIRFSTGSWTKDTGTWWLVTLFGNDPVTESHLETRTVTVNENEFQLEQSETRPIPAPDFTDSTYHGYTTSWLSDDLAFGIASVDSVWTAHYDDEFGREKHGDSRFDLVETGTDAVSDLPNNN